MFVDVHQLAKEFNRSDSYVHKLAKEGIIPRAQKNQYDVVECWRGYGRWMQAQLQRRGATEGVDIDALDGDRERAGLLKAQREKAEMEVEQMRGNLVSRTDFENGTIAVLSAVKQQLLQMPGRVAPQLEGENRITIKQRLTDALHKCLMALSRGEAEDVQPSS